jgi:FkbM family methyltransferase
MGNYLKLTAKRIFGVLGLEIIRKRKGMTLETSLANIRNHGFFPKTVIDVGAAFGTFPLYEAFPDAFMLLVEPLWEWKQALESVCRMYKGDYIIAAAGDRPGETVINVHEDLIGSSFLKEVEGSSVDGSTRTVKVITLDQICQEKNLAGPYLIKVDVQGAELNVMDGAEFILQETEVIILEVSLFKFMISNPEIQDVLIYMKKRGFVTYDIFGYQFRPLDGALSQVDMVFVKEDGLFRQSHAFASPRQRERMTQLAKSEVKKKMRGFQVHL